MASSAHCRLSRDAALVGVRRRGAAAGGDAVGGAGEVVEVGALGVVELQRPRQRLQHAGGGAGDLAALEPGVVLHAQPGERRDLAAPQARHAAVAGGGQPDLVRGDARAAGGEELAHLLSVVHVLEPRPLGPATRAARGALLSAPLGRDSHTRAPSGFTRGVRQRSPNQQDDQQREEEPSAMRQVVMHAPGDVRVEDREDPTIIEPTDAIIRLSATCICGQRPVALPGRRAGRAPGDGPRVRRRGRGDRRRGPHRQGRATSWSARSGPPTTPARSAGPATRPTACTAC